MSDFKNKGKPGPKGTVEIDLKVTRNMGGVDLEPGRHTVPVSIADLWVGMGIAEVVA